MSTKKYLGGTSAAIRKRVKRIKISTKKNTPQQYVKPTVVEEKGLSCTNIGEHVLTSFPLLVKNKKADASGGEFTT